MTLAGVVSDKEPVIYSLLQSNKGSTPWDRLQPIRSAVLREVRCCSAFLYLCRPWTGYMYTHGHSICLTSTYYVLSYSHLRGVKGLTCETIRLFGHIDLRK